jgi:hypothetical protein
MLKEEEDPRTMVLANMEARIGSLRLGEAVEVRDELFI